MIELQKVKEIIKNIDDTYKMICVGDAVKSYDKFKVYAGDITMVYTDFIGVLPELSKHGVDISEELLLQQISNVSEALEYRDSILLADSLKYEVREALGLYIEIMEQCEKEGIVL